MARKKKEAVEQGPVQGKWDLPAGWEWKRLGECTLPITRFAPTKTAEDVFQYIEISCIDNIKHKITAPQIVPVKEASTRARQIMQGGDILFSGTRVYLENIAQVPDELSGAIASTAFAVLRPSECLLSQYAFYYVTSKITIRELTELQRGNSPPAISDPDFFSYPIPLPPTLQDQKRIVERIDSLFAELDKAEETLRHTITLCEQYKQAVLKAAVTGELSKEWRKANPPKETGEQLLQRILKERRAAWEKAELAKMASKGQKPTNDNWKKKYKEPKAPDTSGLPELPEGWTWASVEQLYFVDTGATPQKGNSNFYENGVIPWVTSTCVNAEYVTEPQGYITSTAIDETNCKVFKKGTLIVAMYGEGKTRGKIAELKINAATNQACAAIYNENISIAIKQFTKLFFSYNYQSVRSGASGGVQPNLNLSMVKAILIPIAGLQEIEYINYNFIQHHKGLFETLLSCERQLAACTALRQSILKQAFTGQLI